MVNSQCSFFIELFPTAVELKPLVSFLLLGKSLLELVNYYDTTVLAQALLSLLLGK